MSDIDYGSLQRHLLRRIEKQLKDQYAPPLYQAFEKMAIDEAKRLKKFEGAHLRGLNPEHFFFDENPDDGAINRAIANLTKKVPMMKYELKLTFEDGGTTTIKADEGASCTPVSVGIFDENTDILTSRLTRVELIGTRVEKKKCSECGCEKDG